MSHKKWIIADGDKDKASALSEKLNIDPLIAFLLVSRGIDDELTATGFLTDSIAYGSPFSFKDMDKAVDRINAALDMNERICIYGDYDCDGVTATALLYSFFESIGADVIYYIPNRLTEGYGMNKSAIDIIKSKGTDLIVTVDNGISALDEAEYIYSLGMELVITDHHQIGESLPRAEAVVNPHRADNKIRFRDFAGVGVAFKLACALFDGDVYELMEQYADLVALGTIGDVVALKDENRGFVKAGLNLINSDSRIGLAMLKKAAGGSDDISAVDAAFQLCPRINAAGRMDDAAKAVELLICEDYEEAQLKAEQLNLENVHRHEVESNILDDIKAKVEKHHSLVDDRVIVIDGNGYHKGVIGIVASHLVSMFGKPAIVIGVDEITGEGTGSARSIDGFNIFEAVSACSACLTHFGGHPLAAGLGIHSDSILDFRKAINAYAEKTMPVMPAESLKIDIKISPFYLDTDLVDNLKILEPYGAENMQPVFGLFNMILESVTPIGDDKHIRLDVSKKGKSFRVVKFRTTADDFPYAKGDHIDLAVKISKNLYKGRYYLSIQAVDIRKHGIDDDKFFKEKSDYELFRLGNKNETELYPTREVCSVVYKYLRQLGGYKYSLEDLYFALNQTVTYGQLCYALDAFCEAGLIAKEKTISLNQVSGKADLENTVVLKELKGRVQLERE